MEIEVLDVAASAHWVFLDDDEWARFRVERHDGGVCWYRGTFTGYMLVKLEEASGLEELWKKRMELSDGK